MTNRQERRKAKKLAKKGQGDVIDSTVFSLLEHGAAAHKSGNLDLAEKIYHQILAQQPNNADALHLLGLIYGAGTDLSQGIALIRQAIKVSDQPVFHNNIAPLLHDIGKIDEAISEFKIYLVNAPDDTDALNTLGNYYREIGKFDQAVETYRTALHINPDIGGIHNNLALAYHATNNYEQALASLDQSLSLNSDDVLALNNLALVQVAMGDFDAARDNYKRALKIDPNFAPADYNYVGLLQDDDLEEAEERLRRTLLNKSALSPKDQITPLRAMVSLLGQQERWVECLDYTQQALELRPNDAALLTLFGNFLVKLNQSNDAIPFFEGAISINPNFVDAYIGMSKVYCDNTEYELAVAQGDLALAINNTSPLALINKGAALEFLGRHDEAYECLQKCIDVAPGVMDGHFNLSFVLLSLGKLEQAWKEYRQRYHAPMFTARKRKFPQPEWSGEPLKGKRILLWAEQGLGDEILFANPISDVLQEGGEVHIECVPRLKAIFQRSFPVATVHEAPYQAAETGKDDFDYQIAFPDLCSIYRNSIEDFPKMGGFLTTEPNSVAALKERLDAISDRPKIGISWRSMVMTKTRQRNYAKVEELAPILNMKGVDFINLQYGDCKDELAEVRERFGIELHDWDDIDLKDNQEQLAALIKNMDMVVGASNATTNLAGALGVPTCLFLSGTSWVTLGQNGLPWFPTITTFIKTEGNDSWDEVFGRIVEKVQDHAGLVK